MAVCLCACVAVWLWLWLCGCVAVWLCGCVAVAVCGLFCATIPSLSCLALPLLLLLLLLQASEAEGQHGAALRAAQEEGALRVQQARQQAAQALEGHMREREAARQEVERAQEEVSRQVLKRQQLEAALEEARGSSALLELQLKQREVENQAAAQAVASVVNSAVDGTPLLAQADGHSRRSHRHSRSHSHSRSSRHSSRHSSSRRRESPRRTRSSRSDRQGKDGVPAETWGAVKELSELEQLRSEVFHYREKSRTLEEIAREARRSAEPLPPRLTLGARDLLPAPTALPPPQAGLQYGGVPATPVTPSSSSTPMLPQPEPYALQSDGATVSRGGLSEATMEDVLRLRRKQEYQNRLRETLDRVDTL